MKKLLFISHRLPYPPDKGERLRAFNEIRTLSQHFDITLASSQNDKEQANDTARHLRKYCSELLLVNRGGVKAYFYAGCSMLMGRSASEGFFKAHSLARAIASHCARRQIQYDAAVGYCSSMLPTLLAAPARKRIMDLVDIDSAKWLACSRVEKGPKALIHAREARCVRKLEQATLNRCDAVIVSSQAEADLLAARGEKTYKLTVIANGVDCDYFEYHNPSPEPAAVFTGTMDYAPNVDAVLWLVSEVWPQVRRQFPEGRLIIVGRNPVENIRNLSGSHGIEVTGEVEDVRPYLRQAAVAVAPLRIARGIQNKVLEAMAAGPVVVASPAAMEGLELTSGIEVLCGEAGGGAGGGAGGEAGGAGENFACQIMSVFSDNDLRERISSAARSAVVSNYGWQARMKPLTELCLNPGATSR